MNKGWQKKRLGDVCEIIKGRKPTLKTTASPGDLPYLVARVMRGTEHAEFASVNDRNSIAVDSAETIIICDGSNSGEVFTGFRGILSSTMGKISKKTEINDDYLRAFLSSTFEIFNGAKTGAAIPHLDKDALYQLEFPLPPLSEQRRIVATLSKAFDGIATATANANRNLLNSNEILQCGIRAAVSGELSKNWRDQQPELGATAKHSKDILNKRCKRSDADGNFIEPKLPICVSELKIPNSWTLVTPEHISTHIVDCPHSTPKWTASGVCCLRTTNFKPGILDLELVRYVSEETYKERIVRLEPKSGDILYSREGGILGIACVFPEGLRACLGQRMMQFRLDSDLVLPLYFTNVLNSQLILSEVKRLTGGAAAPHLNIRDIRTFPIPLPPLAEQHEILKLLDVIFTSTKRLASIYQRKLASLDELKKSLLYQAFAGQL